MQAESQRTYGRGLDLAILPEVAVTGETGPDVAATAVPLDGEVGADLRPLPVGIAAISSRQRI